MSTEQVQIGVVKKKLDKGFGFITNSESGKDIFFHARDCVNPTFDNLRTGSTVNYVEKPDKKGVRAAEVVTI